MSSRSYFYNKHPSRSKSYYGKKKMYGSAYQPGQTTKYQRYGRTMRLDPSYISIPRELPTRQSQLRQLEELRKAGLIPDGPVPQVYNYNVEGLMTLPSDQYMAQGSTFTAVCPTPHIRIRKENIEIPNGNTLSFEQLIINRFTSEGKDLNNLRYVSLLCYCSSTFGALSSGKENGVAIVCHEDASNKEVIYFRAQSAQSFNCVFRIAWRVKYFQNEGKIKYRYVTIDGNVDQGTSNYFFVDGSQGEQTNKIICRHFNALSQNPSNFVSLGKKTFSLTYNVDNQYKENLTCKAMIGQRTTADAFSTWAPNEFNFNVPYYDTNAGSSWTSVKFGCVIDAYYNEVDDDQ